LSGVSKFGGCDDAVDGGLIDIASGQLLKSLN
jgi:hypothetical protein